MEDTRIPLKAGHIVKMPNHGRYVIREQIGAGGLSLIYSAETKNNHYPVIIKEFFPSDHAHRAEKTIKAADGTVLFKKGLVYPDRDGDERFERCRKAFEQEGQLGSSARMKSFQMLAFSDCGSGYAVLPRWSGDSCSFEDLVNGWITTPPNPIDPVFTDLARIRFALSAVSSLLNALDSLHRQNMLHLDISPSNVVWAGQLRTAPRNGTAFLTDFGCSVLMADGAYPAEYALSYSKDFAAPEYTRKGGHLDRTTDIYSVGRMLAYLCRGRRVFYQHSDLRTQISRLNIPERHRYSLFTIIERATAFEMTDRFSSAAEMQSAVEALLEAIPLHPINADNTTAFTLYSLKTMLEGSLGTQFSWAHELCDRRGVTLAVPECVCRPVSSVPGGRFADDESFLKQVLPEELSNLLLEKTRSSPDPRKSFESIMAGQYPDEWKNEIVLTLAGYGLRRLISKSRTLLFSETAFADCINFLFRIPGSDLEYFDHCYTIGAGNDRGKGLALLTLFALLGQGAQGFECFANHSPSEIRRMMCV